MKAATIKRGTLCLAVAAKPDPGFRMNEQWQARLGKHCVVTAVDQPELEAPGTSYRVEFPDKKRFATRRVDIFPLSPPAPELGESRHAKRLRQMGAPYTREAAQRARDEALQ